MYFCTGVILQSMQTFITNALNIQKSHQISKRELVLLALTKSYRQSLQRRGRSFACIKRPLRLTITIHARMHCNASDYTRSLYFCCFVNNVCYGSRFESEGYIRLTNHRQRFEIRSKEQNDCEKQCGRVERVELKYIAIKAENYFLY